MKNIRSTDPRKPAIVAALKRDSGGTKVTTLQEIRPGVYHGQCMKKTPGSHIWTYIGLFEITQEEIDR